MNPAFTTRLMSLLIAAALTLSLLLGIDSLAAVQTGGSLMVQVTGVVSA